MVRKLMGLFPRVWRSKIAMLGVVLTTVSACVLLIILSGQILSPTANIYAMSFALMVVPALFVGGLILILVGLRISRKRIDQELSVGAPLRLAPKLLFIGSATTINILLLGGVGHVAMTHMETAEFCGTACHEVMEPQYEAYLRSPHAQVSCVACHVGTGAEAALDAKMKGAHQLWQVLTDGHDRPISGGHAIEGSCERCHQGGRDIGQRVASYIHYASDEHNTAVVNALILKVGGPGPKGGAFTGIHAHADPAMQIRYEVVQEGGGDLVGKIRVFRDGKLLREYLPEEPLQGDRETRRMGCADCHNRQGHAFDHTRASALDAAFTGRVLDPETPFLRKIALQLLERADRARNEAQLIADFDGELRHAYASLKPDVVLADAARAAAAKGLATIYLRNVFPEMNVGWEAYPSHIGHMGDQPDRWGCFRCHDDEHKARDGRVVSQDCDLCHGMLADEEEIAELDPELLFLLFGR